MERHSLSHFWGPAWSHLAHSGSAAGDAAGAIRRHWRDSTGAKFITFMMEYIPNTFSVKGLPLPPRNHQQQVAFVQLKAGPLTALQVRSCSTCLLGHICHSIRTRKPASMLLVLISTTGDVGEPVSSAMPLQRPEWFGCLQIALWTSGIVLLTLLINAPFIPKLLDWTGLVQLSPTKAKMHAKAVRAFIRHTKTLIQDLQNNEDELLRGERFWDLIPS